MKTASRVARAMVSRQWIIATIAVIAGMIVLARLGFWQLDRLDQRRAQNAALAAALASAPVDLNGESLPGDLTSLKNRDAVAQGQFDFAYQGIVKLQNYQNKPGVHLVAPLVLDDGKTAVLVNRGWVPEADSYAAYNEPGALTVNGYIGLTQTLNRDSGVSAVTEELAWYRVDIEAIQAQMPYDLLPIYINQAPEANDAPPFRAEREVDLSEGSHMGYAIQWFIFCATLAIMYAALVYKDVRPK